MRSSRQVTFRVDLTTWTRSKPPAAIRSLKDHKFDVNMLQVLAHTAFCSQPPIAYGFELSSQWAWLRYWPAIATDPDLKLRSEWTGLDPHQKTILSDDLGVGFGSVVLSGTFDLISWPVQTHYLVEEARRRNSGRISLQSANRTGPRKSPDLIGVERSRPARAHVLECKGSQTVGLLQGQVLDGQPQKRAAVFNPASLLGERLVVGLYIPQAESKWPAECLIVDPDHEGSQEAPTVSAQDLVEIAAQSELATVLHMLGLPHLANAVATRHWDAPGINFEVRNQSFDAINGEQGTYTVRHAVQICPPPFDAEVDEGLGRGVEATVGLRQDVLSRLLGVMDGKYANPDRFMEVMTGIVQEGRQREWQRVLNQEECTIASPLGSYIQLRLI